jgi:hypothetical protein
MIFSEDLQVGSNGYGVYEDLAKNEKPCCMAPRFDNREFGDPQVLEGLF